MTIINLEGFEVLAALGLVMVFCLAALAWLIIKAYLTPLLHEYRAQPKSERTLP
jgi:hypothetical protein